MHQVCDDVEGPDRVADLSLDRPAFVNAVEKVAARVSRAKDVDAAFVGAELDETLLRTAGYPQVRVIDRRTVDEAMERIINWTVLRDGEAS